MPIQKEFEWSAGRLDDTAKTLSDLQANDVPPEDPQHPVRDFLEKAGYIGTGGNMNTNCVNTVLVTYGMGLYIVPPYNFPIISSLSIQRKSKSHILNRANVKLHPEA